LAKTEWKQYTSKDRPYFVNSRTKETKWDLPPDLVELKKKVERNEEYKAEKRSRKARGMSR
jgi:pre-mRNA-processing factor 40